jgi:hypothetical protein
MLTAEQLVNSTDEELEDLFQRSTTLPLERIVNAGTHDIDVSRREIFNDASWKGFLPRGLPLGEMAARLATGYAKRFWKHKDQYLGETLYAEGRVTVKHRLDEVTIDRRTNDIDPGRYIILYYTDPVLEHLFYDVMKAVSDDVILYRGYSGRFPDGRRGWTAPLMRRYTFGQMGVEDHQQLFKLGTAPAHEDLLGSWRLDVVGYSTQVAAMANVSFARRDGRLESRCEGTEAGRGLLPGLVADHFNSADFKSARTEMRRADEGVIVGKWMTDLKGPFAWLVRAGSLRMFRVEKGKRGTRRYALHYLLTRV